MGEERDVRSVVVTAAAAMTVTESKFYGHEKYVRKRAEEAVGELNETCEPAKKRYTLRAVRNEIIGDKTKKYAFVSEGAVQAVSQILREALANPGLDANTTDLVIQSAATLGSFSCGLELGAEAVIKSGAVGDLTQLLGSSDSRLVTASARALRLLFQSSKARTLAPLSDSSIRLLIKLLHLKDELTAGVSASILAKCCEIHEQQDQIQSYGGLKAVMSLLQSKRVTHESGEEEQSYLKEGLLTAVGIISLNLEDARRMVIELKGIPTIVESLKDKDERVRAAACLCAKSLSRSRKAIKSSLFDAKIDGPLLSLLSDPSPQVQQTASATLCNLVLSYLPMKENILAAGGVRELASLSKSMDSILRLHSTWAIKNLLYRADRTLKQRVMEELTWPQLLTLLNDSEPEVQVQAVTIVRNLVFGKEDDIEMVVQYQNGEILSILERILSPTSGSSAEMKQHAVYAVSNISSGSDKHKEMIMQTMVLNSVLHCLRDQHSCELRVAAALVIINLTWQDGADNAGVASRIERLKQMGFESQLESMVEDTSLNVKDRVMEALKSLRKHSPIEGTQH